MKALMYTGPKEIKVENIEEPKLDGTKSMVSITAAGICGSDIEGFLGKTGRRTAPMIMGHELAGVIAQSAENSRFYEGDKVVIYPKLFCGKCNFCIREKENLCANSKTLGVMETNGGFTEQLAIDDKYLLKAKASTKNSHLAFTEPLSVALHAIKSIESKGLTKQEHIIVIGAGTIGLLACQILIAYGYTKVMVVDKSEYRLRLAEEIGVVPVLSDTNIFNKIDLLTEGQGTNFSVEAVGISPTAKLSIDVLNDGGVAVWVGNAQKIVEIDMQSIVTKEKSVIGSYLYSLEDFSESLKLIEDKKINLDLLISIEAPLINGAQIFDQLIHNEQGKLLKAILLPQ